MSALIFKNYLFKCFNNLSLKVAIFAFKILITSTSEAPFKVFKVLAQTLTFIGLPLNIALFGNESLPYFLVYYVTNTVSTWAFGAILIGNDTNDKDKQGKELTMPYIPTPLDGKVECICCSRVDLSSTDKHKDESCSITFGYESLEEILSSDLPQ